MARPVSMTTNLILPPRKGLAGKTVDPNEI
jgi:hypothetical protein